MFWQTSRFRIDLGRPHVMAIVNLTPDSFSDGGLLGSAAQAVDRCAQLVSEGADILDLGGESTRPGSVQPSPQEEVDRVMPVLCEAVKLGVPVSVDTSHPSLMRAALDAGADIVNDVRALRLPGALEAVAGHPSCGVCVMHMQGEPRSMQHEPVYADVVAEVGGFLRERLAALAEQGVTAERVVLDPGIGFGKSAEHNWELMRRQGELLAIGRPLLLGWSRKSTLGRLTGRPVGERVSASVAAALAAVARGASIVRVHDVAATVDAFKVWQAAGWVADERRN